MLAERGRFLAGKREHLGEGAFDRVPVVLRARGTPGLLAARRGDLHGAHQSLGQRYGARMHPPHGAQIRLLPFIELGTAGFRLVEQIADLWCGQRPVRERRQRRKRFAARRPAAARHHHRLVPVEHGLGVTELVKLREARL